MNPDYIPLLSPKHISQFTPESYKAYLSTLWIDPATTRKAKAKGPTKYLTGTVTKKGTLVIRCKRDPKVVSRAEVEELRASVGLTHLAVWNALRCRNIAIVEELPKQKKIVVTVPTT